VRFAGFHGASPRMRSVLARGGLVRESVSVPNRERTMDASDEDMRGYMRAALDASRNALPACLPNPPVGCVLVRDGVIVARGFTGPPYHPHAEPAAIAQLGDPGDLSDVIAFVTLEPCSFHQRTPSCAKELVARRIGAVYAAMLDPHPRNQGRGIALLREGGVKVEVGLLEAEVRPFLSPYLHSGGAEPPVGW
jgi:pyrimidine deaminase RibD-like protein